MFANFIELYGELERIKNDIGELISLLKSDVDLDVVLTRVYSFLSNWYEIGLDKVNLDFNLTLQRKKFDTNAQISEIKYYLNDYNVGEITAPNLRVTLLNKFETIFQMITDMQTIINQFDTELLYSNKLIKLRFDDLLRDYRMFIRIISPLIKFDQVDIERALKWHGYTIDTVNEFIDDFTSFANNLGIDVIPQTIHALINPLHQKQSHKQYMQKLNEIKDWFDSMFIEIKARLENK